MFAEETEKTKKQKKQKNRKNKKTEKTEKRKKNYLKTEFSGFRFSKDFFDTYFTLQHILLFVSSIFKDSM